MNEEYLWDKTGTDAEIEKLENSLAAFRYREIAPPALPINVAPLKREKSPRRVFQFALAAAACLAIAAFSLSVWLQVSKNESDIGVETAHTVEKLINTEAPKNPISEQAASNPADDNLDAPKQTSIRKAFKIKHAPLAPRPNKIVRRELKSAVPQTAKLTEEEKYAYEQLMLALSITGSKLREVKDKVEGMEE